MAASDIFPESLGLSPGSPIMFGGFNGAMLSVLAPAGANRCVDDVRQLTSSLTDALRNVRDVESRATVVLERIEGTLPSVEDLPSVQEDIAAVAAEVRRLRRVVDDIQDRQIVVVNQLHEVQGALRGFIEEMRVRLMSFTPVDSGRTSVASGSGVGRGGRSR